MLRIQMASRSEIGARRRNEDDLRLGRRDAIHFAVLSDGAGGHHGGALASDLVVRLTALGLQAAEQLDAASLTQLVGDTNAALSEQQVDADGDRMHATVVILWLDADRGEAMWTHVGDSRLYLLRQGRVWHCTRDDSVVQGLVEAGYITAQEARGHPARNQLVSAMGVTGALQPHTLAKPLPLIEGDVFLLCTDGWWDHFDRAALEGSLAAAGGPQAWLDAMAEQIHSAAKARQDNYSAIAVWVGDPSQTTVMNSE
jgi:serine/threonine protein phosphatase PrpC